MLQPKVTKIIPNSDYTLTLYYETGEIKKFNVIRYLKLQWYSQLKDILYFKMVKIIDGGKYIEWPDGQDISPHELYECSEKI